MKIEMKDEKLDLGKICGRKSKWKRLIIEFMESDKNSLIFSCSGTYEANSCYSSVRHFQKKYNYVCGKRLTKVYIVKC